MTDMRHLDYLEIVAAGDVKHLLEKEKKYKGSWKQRGGVGAFMMLARKWDRLENMLEQPQTHTHEDVTRTVGQYDLFGEIQANPTGEDGTALAEIGDLRRYLMLVEAEMMARGVVRTGLTDRLKTDEHGVLGPATPEDGGQHESTAPWLTERNIYGDFQVISLVSGKYVLQMFVSLPIPAHHWPRVSRMYERVDGGIVLKLRDCPDSLRSSYPSLPTELNEKELRTRSAPDWLKKHLYSWNEAEDKYVLKHPEFHYESTDV